MSRAELGNTPLVIDITPLKRQPGTRHHVKLSILPPDGLVLASAEVSATQLHLDLQLEGAGEELIASGNIEIDWNGPCRRLP